MNIKNQTLIENFMENVFKARQILLPKMKRKTSFDDNGNDFEIKPSAYGLTITIPKADINSFFIKNMVI